MKGIQYIADSQGRKTRVVVDLNRYGKEFAVFMESLRKKYNTNNSSGGIFGVMGSGGGDQIGQLGGGHGINATRQAKISQLLQYAATFIGTPYRTGGTTRSGMDCSGFTQTSYKKIGINLPRVSREQARMGQALQKHQLQKGDLLYFATGTPGRVNHVGIVSRVDSNGIKFLHASSSRGIMEASLQLNYWIKAYMGGRRVL
ncbi:MAG: NlpC/P60 family protein [Saprospiraceae bacterium]|nr:NlpC/P60 family protein [Saprospiraceae bacterium]